MIRRRNFIIDYFQGKKGIFITQFYCELWVLPINNQILLYHFFIWIRCLDTRNLDVPHPTTSWFQNTLEREANLRSQAVSGHRWQNDNY